MLLSCMLLVSLPEQMHPRPVDDVETQAMTETEIQALVDHLRNLYVGVKKCVEQKRT